MGVNLKCGLIKTVRTRRKRHIVLTTDDDHNANAMVVYKNTITAVLRPIVHHPFELVKDIESVKIKVYGVFLFPEALGARTGCGKISDGVDSERGRNSRISGGLPEGSKS